MSGAGRLGPLPRGAARGTAAGSRGQGLSPEDAACGARRGPASGPASGPLRRPLP